MSAKRIIGIDLTGTSVIRVKRYENGQPDGRRLDVKPVMFGDRDCAPTMVCTLQSAVYFGVDAEVQMHKQGASAETGFMRGVGEGDEHAESLCRQYLAYLAKKYREQSAAGYLGEAEDKECIKFCCPAAWSEQARIFLSSAAMQAGFDDVWIMEKEIAQVLAALLVHEEKIRKMGLFRAHTQANILLIDMSTDMAQASICRCAPDSEPWLQLLATSAPLGDPALGGRQIDLNLMKYIGQMLPAAYSSIVINACGEQAFRRWKENVLSPVLAEGGVATSFSDLESLLPDGENPPLAISRLDFEQMMRPYLQGLSDMIGTCLNKSGVSAQDVDLVVLSGSGSKWYFVRDLLLGSLPGLPAFTRITADLDRILTFAQPKEAAALGMALSDLSVDNLISREAVARVKKDGLWGMIDQTGKTFIPCQWKELRRYHEGYVWAKDDAVWHLLDDAGKEKLFLPKATDCKDVQEGAFVARIAQHEVHHDLIKNKTIGYNWDKAESFKDGVAKVQLGGKYGLIDRAGEPIGKTEWNEVYDLNDGLYQVCKGSKWGCIDRTGKLVVKCEWDDIERFENGAARVRKGSSVGFIDRSGRLLAGKLWTAASTEVSEGMIWVVEYGKFGFISVEGKRVIPCKYTFASDFHQGYAIVKDTGGYGLIDREGNCVVECKWSDISYLREGFIRVKNASGMWQYIDVPRGSHPELSNRYNPLRAQWAEAGDFTNGFAIVGKNGDWGLLNTQGQLIGKRFWQAIGTIDSSSDFVCVAANDKWGYLNYKTGILDVDCVWDSVSNVMGASACVKLDGRCGIIDQTGKFLSPCKWDEIRFYWDGNLGAMRLGDQWGLITRHGKVVSECQWDEHEYLWSDYVKVRKGDLWALFSPQGEQITACEYEKIENLTGGFFPVMKNGKFGYISTDGKTCVPCQYEEADSFCSL